MPTSKNNRFSITGKLVARDQATTNQGKTFFKCLIKTDGLYNLDFSDPDNGVEVYEEITVPVELFGRNAERISQTTIGSTIELAGFVTGRQSTDGKWFVGVQIVSLRTLAEAPAQKAIPASAAPVEAGDDIPF